MWNLARTFKIWLILGCGLCSATLAFGETQQRYDLNDDGNINILDAMSIIFCIIGAGDCPEQEIIECGVEDMPIDGCDECDECEVCDPCEAVISNTLDCGPWDAVCGEDTVANDEGECLCAIEGCTNEDADNYTEFANIDDGNCIYYGCTGPDSINYDPSANTDDGSCIYPTFLCDSEEDCSDDEWCRSTEIGGTECVYYAHFGEICGDSDSAWLVELCAPPLECSQGGESSMQQSAGMCVIPDACSQNGDCEDDEWCREGELGALECIPYAEEGESCEGFVPSWLYDLCGQGLVCESSNPDLVGVCVSNDIVDCDYEYVLDCFDLCSPVNWIGDGWCDDGTWGAYFNCPEFDNDADDCLVLGCTDVSAFNYDLEANQDDGTCEYSSGEECTGGYILDCEEECAPENWLGDGWCDDGYWGGGNFNCELLEWDGGDCVPCFDCLGQDCAGYELWIGDGLCDDGTWGLYFNCEDYDCDAGDCDCADTSCTDCLGQDCTEYESWIGDGLCDDGEWGLYFNCEDYDCDGGDCEDDNCDATCAGFGFLEDCVGSCIDNESCQNDTYDCCVDDGNCPDQDGDGISVDWIGDGYCDDGAYGLDLNCEAYDFDEADCGDSDGAVDCTNCPLSDGFSGELVDFGGCGDALFYAWNADRTIEVIVEFDDVVLDAYEMGEFNASISLPDWDVNVIVNVGENLGDMTCDSSNTYQEEITDIFYGTEGIVELAVMPEDGFSSSSEQLALGSLSIQGGVVTNGAGCPVEMGELVWENILIGWLPTP